MGRLHLDGKDLKKLDSETDEEILYGSNTVKSLRASQEIIRLIKNFKPYKINSES
jgi:hypothetical protein